MRESLHDDLQGEVSADELAMAAQRVARSWSW